MPINFGETRTLKTILVRIIWGKASASNANLKITYYPVVLIQYTRKCLPFPDSHYWDMIHFFILPTAYEILNKRSSPTTADSNADTRKAK